MPAKRLSMRQIREVLRLKHQLGLTHRAVAKACSVGLGTVTLYLQRAEELGLGWPLPSELDDAALEARLFPRAAPLRERMSPNCPEIHRELKRTGVTLRLLWEEYQAVHGDGYRYSQFCEIYRRWARKLKPSMRQVHRAGEKTFTDFSGKQPHIVDRRTGEQVAVELFVGVLGASSLTYAEATESQQLPCWVGAHTRMVEFFEGSTEIWVPDQLKSAVTHNCRYEPGINRTYQELAAHYGAVVIPARPRKPKDKDQPAYCTSSLLCGASFGWFRRSRNRFPG
jgi:transposase